MFLKVLLCIIFCSSGVELLSPINEAFNYKPCRFSDPEFEQCALTAADRFLQKFNQDKPGLLDRCEKFSLREIEFPILQLNDKKNIFINISEARAHGFEATKFLSIRKHPTKNRIDCTLELPEANIFGNFDMAAKIGNSFVAGKNPAVWSFGIKYNVSFEWEPKYRLGIKYVNIVDFNITYTATNVFLDIRLEKGNNLEKVFNKNSDLIVEQIRPAGISYAKELFTLFTHKLFNYVPYNKIFLD